MAADHIPFLNSATDCQIANRWYADSAFLRMSLETLPRTLTHVPVGPKRWLDPAIDGLHWTTITSDSYKQHISRFKGYDSIADETFQQRPDKAIVNSFVGSILDYCIDQVPAPDLLSVPQLPLVDDASRNKINKALAESTSDWKSKRHFQGKLIVPAIFTNQRQINRKTERNKKLSAILNSYRGANANGVWAVDATLNDQDGSRTFEHTRFPELMNLHTELNEILPSDAITIAGPYWGINVVLWARGLAKFSATGMGNSYQYHIPGTVVLGGKSRLALSPLRRWAIASPKLKHWIDDVVARLPVTDAAHGHFSAIAKEFARLQTPIEGRRQIAHFYKSWFDRFSVLPQSGRALALYQDLSSAYILGKRLPELPEEEKTARSPARVAKQLMLNCL